MFGSLKYYFRFRATQRVPKVCNEREKGKKLKFTLQSPDCHRAKIRITLDANVPCLFTRWLYAFYLSCTVSVIVNFKRGNNS